MSYDRSIMSLIIAVLAFLLLRQCNAVDNCEESENINGVTERIDSSFSVGKIDSIPFPVKEFETKWLKPDTVYLIAEIGEDGAVDSIYEGRFEYSDTAIDAVITCKGKGQLLDAKLKYIKKFPMFLSRTDTLRIDKESIVVKDKWEVYAGGIIGGNVNSFQFQPALLVRVPKRDLQLSFGYELINQTYNLGVYTRIKLRNPFKKKK